MDQTMNAQKDCNLTSKNHQQQPLIDEIPLLKIIGKKLGNVQNCWY